MSRPLLDLSNQKARPIPDGLKARFKHQYEDVIVPYVYHVVQRMVTHVVVYDPLTKAELAVGQAICGPRDTYRRKVGNHIALQRALKDLDRWDQQIKQDEEAATIS